MKKIIQLQTSKKEELVDITNQVKKAVEESKVKDGLCNVYIPHATAAIIVNENYDPSLCLDILEYLRNSIPDGKWRHDQIDNNASAHIKAAILGPQETIPITDGKLSLGTWQGIAVAELDGPRNRKIIVTIINE